MLLFQNKAALTLLLSGGFADVVKAKLAKDGVLNQFMASFKDLTTKRDTRTVDIGSKGSSGKEDFTSCRVSDLPQNFAFGTATASFQIEGATSTDGRGPSIWDDLCKVPGRIANGDTGDVADDFYHKFQQDIEMMKSLGLKHFRMSLSWSRILPNGTVD